MLIFLTGFMGCGKSYWGKRWAAVSGMSFYDLDWLIEQHERKPVADIFRENGESYFRNIESALLRNHFSSNDGIVACGGGTPCFDDNMAWMNNHGYTVFLNAHPDYLLKNLTNETDNRPVLGNIDHERLLNFIHFKLKEREPVYKMAKMTLQAETLDDQTIHTIIASAHG